MNIASVFSDNGVLASRLRGFRPRSQQTEMAQRIANAIQARRVFIAEAGTGTGKTFAYLVPALLSQGKVIVSTGTKTLQDQLFDKDLPMVREALGIPVRVALLKGRANYVCHYHLELAMGEGRFHRREDAALALRIARFAKISTTGDRSECHEVPEDATVWSQVTSTRDNCLGQECPHNKECFVMAARREALAADIVVVNHHLFFADLALRDEGAGELLPAADAVIFDEAHQLPEVATLFLGSTLTTSQLLDLSRDTLAESLVAAKDFSPLADAARQVEKKARDVRLSVGHEPGRFDASQLGENTVFLDALQTLVTGLEHLETCLESQAERSEGLKRCHERCQDVIGRLDVWQKVVVPERTSADGGDREESSGLTLERKAHIPWGEAFSHAFHFNLTPLDIAPYFSRQIAESSKAWIFTSATLSVRRDFQHYCTEMGLIEAESAAWDSPFDYQQQSLLYAPQGLPDPNTLGYTAATVDAAWPIVQAAGGRTFFLCTSLRAMRMTRECLAQRMAEEGMSFPLLMQGEGAKGELLDQFRRMGNAILVGSHSFWEGVDVRGDALSLVVIDKLPFAPPDDPVLAARLDRIQREGRSGFMEYQLPRAIIQVKQGAGRLIRDEADRGVLMICDPRMLSKGYGSKVWQSLPPMRRTKRLQDVLHFFSESSARHDGLRELSQETSA